MLLLMVGCGAKQPVKTPTPVAVDASPAVAEEPPDLSPVQRPSDVVAVGRLARPRLFIETLAKWSSLPVTMQDLLPEEARALGSALLWEAPVDLVVALDAFGEGKVPPPLVVASVGITSLEAGLSAAERMQLPTRQLAPGIFRVGDFSGSSCALSASVGAAPARLVCGKATKDVDALLPYATRGLPREPQSGADFELILDAAPIQARYGGQITALRLLAGVAMREVALDAPRFDRALSDAIYGGIDETINLFGDLEQLRIEARLDASRNVLLGSAQLRLKGNSSWTAGTLAAIKPVPVPATLPRLPPGTSCASYTAPLPAERYTAMSRIALDLAEGYLEHEKLPAATRQRLRRALEPWLAKLPESFSFAVASSRIGADGAARFHPDTTVTRLSEASPRVLSAYSELFGLVNDPALKSWVQSKGKLDKKLWPKLSKKPLKLAGFKTPATVFDLTLDAKALAAASPGLAKALERFMPQAEQKLASFTLVVQPDGAYTYVASGEDATEIARVMAEHKKNEPGAFFARPARAEAVTAAGFFTLAYAARTLERSGDVTDLRRALAAAPHHGDTPLPFSTSVGRFDIEAPADFFSDVSAMAVSAGGRRMKDVLEKVGPKGQLQ